MKKLPFILLVLATLLFPGICQSSNSNLFNQDDVQKEIDLMGSLAETSIRSVLPEPIYASIGSISLNVDFLYNIGNIDVEIYSITGAIVYSQSVNTQTQEQLSIDVTEWDSDFYEIRIVGSTGNYMYGTFEIE
ncbi:DUF3244 domain-containing protein [Geofilum sp. OHC36d9]|uniref:DUF3244 domain-containing protein n=1 Tax=Geofilum sp. OHC36d9 TaxID=3458413 RepID=UPI0040340B1B